jgi:hypothetical protein
MLIAVTKAKFRATISSRMFALGTRSGAPSGYLIFIEYIGESLDRTDVLGITVRMGKVQWTSLCVVRYIFKTSSCRLPYPLGIKVMTDVHQDGVYKSEI